MKTAEQIIANFSKKALTYDDHAQLQLVAANKLADDLRRIDSSLAPGPILEIGCGTGFMTVPMVETCGQSHDVIVSDITPEMLEICQRRLEFCLGAPGRKVRFARIDANHFEGWQTFSLIVSAFTFQWLADVRTALGQLLLSLKPGGKLLFSVPTTGCFPEWQQICHESGIPFTGNPLPGAELYEYVASRHGCTTDLHTETFTFTYPSALAFFRGIKALGASTALTETQLTTSEMKRLLDFSTEKNPEGMTVTYKVLFGEISRSQLQ
jgi:malonyl-CoA O-methyltransferase